MMMHAKFALEGLTCGTCVGTVDNAIRNHLPGIVPESVHVSLFPDPQLICTYDSKQLTEEQIMERIESVGFEASLLLAVVVPVSSQQDDSDEEQQKQKQHTSTRMHAKFALEGLTCGSCVGTVDRAVRDLPGILPDYVHVSLLPDQQLICTYCMIPARLTRIRLSKQLNPLDLKHP